MFSLVLKSRFSVVVAILFLATAVSSMPGTAHAVENFEGRFYAGQGDIEYLRLLDISRRMFSPDPEFQNITMLYTPSWNGLVEGPTWGAWWVQNSYGPTYCGLPVFDEPFHTFSQVEAQGIKAGTLDGDITLLWMEDEKGEADEKTFVFQVKPQP